MRLKIGKNRPGKKSEQDLFIFTALTLSSNMKTITLFFAVATLLLSVSSCKNCSTCRNYPAKDVELCRKDFATDDSFNAAFRNYEGQGYDCD